MPRFRQATELDVDTVLETMRGYYAEEGYPFVEAETRQALVDLLRDSCLGRLWVADEGDRVVGYLAVTLGHSLEHRGRDAFIDELFIAEEARSRGLGREALLVAETYGREVGVRALHLEVERHRQLAMAIYRRAGFEDHGRFLLTKRLDGEA